MSDVTRAGRLATLRQLVNEARYASQADLIEALAAEGITVSQPTLSKDLLVLGAVRQRAADGSLVYAAGSDEDRGVTMDKLARLCAEMLQSLRAAGNQIVLKVPPGAAQYFAASLDAAALAAEGTSGASESMAARIVLAPGCCRKAFIASVLLT